LKTDWYQ